MPQTSTLVRLGHQWPAEEEDPAARLIPYYVLPLALALADQQLLPQETKYDEY